jgi:hypothetical protein
MINHFKHIVLAMAGYSLAACMPTPEEQAQQIEKMLLEDPTGGPVFQAVKRHFPEDFGYLVEDIREVPMHLRRDEAYMLNLTARWLVELQNDNIPFVIAAPPKEMNALARADLALMDELRVLSPLQCKALVVGQTVSLMGRARSAMPRMVARNIAFFEASAAGRDNPQMIVEPPQRDFDLVTREIRAYGISERVMSALGDPAALQALDPNEACDLGIALTSAVLELPEERAGKMNGYLLGGS